VKNVFWFVTAVFLSCMTSCAGNGHDSSVATADTLQMKYAEHLTVVKYHDYTVVTLSNPWKKGEMLHKYILVERADSASVGSLPQGTVIYTPVKRSVVFTSPHSHMMCLIGASDAIKGVCDAIYMNDKHVRDGLENDGIADCGDAMAPSVEKIAAVDPQILMLSPFENAGYGKLERTGIPILECADYMETSALGRAEWIRFYGMLFGRERQADSVFHVVDSCYGRLKALAATSRNRPSILTERKTGNVWYCPGGRSSMGKLIADANARYAFSADTSSGSLSLAPEYVLDRAGDSDVWMFVNNNEKPITKGELLDEYAGYAQLKAFRTNNIYECRASHNSYFDDLSFHPDYMLRELIAILHPDIISRDSLMYYDKVAGTNTGN